MILIHTYVNQLWRSCDGKHQIFIIRPFVAGHLLKARAEHGVIIHKDRTSTTGLNFYIA